MRSVDEIFEIRVTAQERPPISLLKAIITGLIIDFVLLLLASMMMDMGESIHFIFSVVCGHWVGNFIIIFRRFSKATRGDKDFIRFGALILILITLPIAIITRVYADWFFYTFHLAKIYRYFRMI